MVVKVKLFGALAMAAGAREVGVPLDEGATVTDMLDRLSGLYPGLQRFLPEGPERLLDALMVVVGRAEAEPDQQLQPGEEVVLILPVSGGAI